jgi:hypothetical protein
MSLILVAAMAAVVDTMVMVVAIAMAMVAEGGDS